MGCDPGDVGVEVQRHQIVAFALGLEADVALVRGAPPEAGKVVLSLEGRRAPDRQGVLKREHPGPGKKAGRRCRGILPPEGQGAWSNVASGASLGRRRSVSHALTVVRRNRLMLK